MTFEEMEQELAQALDRQAQTAIELAQSRRAGKIVAAVLEPFTWTGRDVRAAIKEAREQGWIAPGGGRADRLGARLALVVRRSLEDTPAYQFPSEAERTDAERLLGEAKRLGWLE